MKKISAILHSFLRSVPTPLCRCSPRPPTPTSRPFRTFSPVRFSASFISLLDAPSLKPQGPARTPPKQRPKALTRKDLPELIEEELEETFVRGSGPGGQSINKTSISCSLIHLPTGIRVQCHETRSRELNRLKARRRLQEKLDLLQNPGKSLLEQGWSRERMKKEAKKRKQERKKAESTAQKDDVTTLKGDEEPFEKS